MGMGKRIGNGMTPVRQAPGYEYGYMRDVKRQLSLFPKTDKGFADPAPSIFSFLQ